MNETSEFRSLRDSDGHETRTASGRYVFPASTLGYAKGFAGMLVVMIDILAAFDSAVADGVDVISSSIGGVVVSYFLDTIAIGAFGAIDKVATIGAGTIDRDFPADVKLENGKVVPGVNVYNGSSLLLGWMYLLVYAGTGGGDGVAKKEIVKKVGGIGMILANGVFDRKRLVADCHANHFCWCIK
ncbi:hypothetical protein REPUB_Repub10bG0130600 [Reevesia pubescens]